LGCAQKETNLFYSQKADGILGVMSLYESLDYAKVFEEDEETKHGSQVRRIEEKEDQNVKAIIDDELSHIIKEKDGTKNVNHYTDEHVPSILNDLYVQKKIKNRKFAICLGYKKGFLNFNGWNSRTLRILNYDEIENKLNDKYKTSEESRVLYRSLLEISKRKEPKSPTKRQEWNETIRTPNSKQTRKLKQKLNHNLHRLVEEIFIDKEKTLEETGEDTQMNPLFKMNKVEEKAIKVLEELLGASIISDKIQHIRIPLISRYQFLYTGKITGLNVIGNKSSDEHNIGYTLKRLEDIEGDLIRPDLPINEEGKFDTGTTIVYFSRKVYRSIETVSLFL
jgi:hypothetical protein